MMAGCHENAAHGAAAEENACSEEAAGLAAGCLAEGRQQRVAAAAD